MMSTSKCGHRSLSSIKDVMIRMCQVILLSMALSIILKNGANAATQINASSLLDGNYELTDDTVIIIDQNVTRENCVINYNGHNLTITDPNDTGNTLKILRIYDTVANRGNLTVSSGKIELSVGIGCENFTMTGGSVTASDEVYASDSVNISGGTIILGQRLYGKNSVTISGGTVNINAENMNGIESQGNISITGGSVTAISTVLSGISAFGNSSTVTIENNAYVKAQGPRSAIRATNVITVNGEAVGQVEADGKYHYGGTSIEINAPQNANPTNTGNTTAPVVKQTADKTESSSHTHSYSWVVTKYPTSTSDGEEAYMCSCGDVARTSILPAISAFEEETINKIKNAPANGVIEVETSLFNSFGVGVRDALATREDVTLKVSFLEGGYKGQRLKVTIPAGADRSKHWDKNGWLGLLRAGTIFGYDQ